MPVVEKLNKDAFLVNITLSGLADDIRFKVEQQEYFTYTVSDPDLRPGKVHLYFVSLARVKMTYLAMGVKIGRTTSGQYSIKLSRIIGLGDIPFRKIFPEGRLSETYAKTASEQIAMRIPENFANQILELIGKSEIELVDDINKLVRLINADDIYKGDSKAEIFALEREATRTALKVFGLEYGSVFSEWDEDSFNAARSYAQGLPKRYMREDEMAFRDARHFEGFEYIGDVDVTTLAFERRGHRIKITYANRAKAEKLVGVDLVYANEADDSFALVQYKRLLEEAGGYRYRPRQDDNHDKELRRMVHLRSVLDGIFYQDSLQNYRFTESPFFFKFCRSVIFEPRANSAIEGFYISLEAWERFMDQFPDGSEKPPVASEGTCKKVFNNQTFCHLLANGLIGSRAIHSRVIAPILNSAMEGDKALVYASHERVLPESRKPRTGSRRGKKMAIAE